MPRRISVRKIIQTLVTLVTVAGCAVAMLSADRRQESHTIRDVQLHVESSGGVHFLTEEDVYRKLFTARHLTPESLRLSALDTRSMEAILKSNPWVREAQVYADAERVLHVTVAQRVPVVRLFAEDGTSYYLDAALQTMPLSGQYTHYTPVVTGVPVLGNDSVGNAIRGKILGLVQRIGRDSFWAAQVSQVNMRAGGGFELIPVLGRQCIILGDTTKLAAKLGNLFAFYKQVQNKVGWDKYNTLDLRYDGQVVASPALPWKAPVDKALSNINWLKAIMDNAPARQSQLGNDASPFADSVSAGANAMPKPVTSADTQKPAKPVVHAAAAITSPAPALKNSASHPAAKTIAADKQKNTTHQHQNTSLHAAAKR